MVRQVDRDLLKKLLLVALSSPSDGEIVAAVSALKNRIKKQGKDIHWFADLIDGNLIPLLPEVAVVDWQHMLQLAALEIWRLSPREQEFITSLRNQMVNSGKYWQPSPRQRQWLSSIYRRVKMLADIGF